jgi:L-glyceraldehyde 3-phosphate reductase
MIYRPIGATGIEVSEIGFGTGGTAGLMVRGAFDEQLRTVARALDLGINYFDTAPDYGDGVSETNLGRVLLELGARPIITTKVEVRAADLDDIAGHIERSLDGSLQRLGVDHVDFLQVHNGPVRERPALSGRDYRVLGIDDYFGKNGAIEGLERVRGAGKTRFTGFICRGDDGEEVRQLIDTGLFSLVNLIYTLLNPTAVKKQDCSPDFGQVIPYAQERGVGVAVYSPLAGGLLTDEALKGAPPHPLSGAAARAGQPSDQRQRQLDEAARFQFLTRGGSTPLSQAAVRFILAEAGVSTVLGGFSDIAQLEDIVAASEAGPLSAADLAEIDLVWQGHRAAG